MPLKRTYSTSTSIVPEPSPAYKKRNMSRRTIRRRPTLQLLSAPGTPFPQRCRAVLKYTSYFNLDPAVGTTGQWLLRCNSAYDPDFSGTGGQPRGYDQYAALYNQYTVNKTTLKMFPVTPNTGATGQAIIGITMIGDSSGLAAIDQCADRPFTVWKCTNQQTSAKDNMLKMVWDRKKRFPKNDMAASLSAAVSTNPAEEEFFQFWYYSAYNPLTANPGELTMQYEMTLDIEFYELKQIPAS